MTDLAAALASDLAVQINGLYPESNYAELNARMRLDRLAEAAPIILLLLAEPWYDMLKGQSGAFWQKLLYLSRLHLYSRVLDDALDEGESCQKQALLRIQPLFWETVCQLTLLSPQLAGNAQNMIRMTVQAVLANDHRNTPEHWGAKNGHLLLIPLYLSENVLLFAKFKQPLLQALALLQAWDEYKQGSYQDKGEVCKLIACTLAPNTLDLLAGNGWRTLAEKLYLESKRLLRVLEDTWYGCNG